MEHLSSSHRCYTRNLVQQWWPGKKKAEDTRVVRKWKLQYFFSIPMPHIHHNIEEIKEKYYRLYKFKNNNSVSMNI